MSEVETLKHIKRVNEFLIGFAQLLLDRAVAHDASKLEEPEKSAFEAATGKLKGLTYGSDEYRATLRENLGPAIRHHYDHNSHHPEHYTNGIPGMDLLDVVEMFCDWLAAAERHADGDMAKSIDINQERFGYTDELRCILSNSHQKISARLK